MPQLLRDTHAWKSTSTSSMKAEGTHDRHHHGRAAPSEPSMANPSGRR